MISMTSPIWQQIKVIMVNILLYHLILIFIQCDFMQLGRGCGGELYNYGGTFSSPGYPNTDRNNSDCTWTINVPMNLMVAIHFAGKFIYISYKDSKYYLII